MLKPAFILNMVKAYHSEWDIVISAVCWDVWHMYSLEDADAAI